MFGSCIFLQSFFLYFAGMNSSTNLINTKPHYQILDGLRGVAAVIVVLFHILEAHALGKREEQIINHGYLAVDFFFLLSGFVISYAYDDRWNKMTLKGFFLRRIIRLHPMIIIGSLIGALLFYFQDSAALGMNTRDVSVGSMLIVMLIGCTLFPVGKSLDIRGWNEMHPLNGPAWSLFFEYIANITYALVLRHLPNVILFILAIGAACFTLHHLLTHPNGDMIGGWTIDNPEQLKIGFTRLAYPFLAGILLARLVKLKPIHNAFPITAIFLAILLAMPRIGVKGEAWQNGLYDALCILILFPLIIWLGAGGHVKGKKSQKFCKFMGDISYPIYITHYPLIYTYTAWVANGDRTLGQFWLYGTLTFVGSVMVAYVAMRWYDIPVREWLRKRFLV